MQNGLSTADFLVALQCQGQGKADYIADTRAIRAIPNGGLKIQVRDVPASVLELGRNEVDKSWSQFEETFTGPLTDYAAGQVAQRLRIPLQYFRRMEESSPALLAANVNHWLADGNEARMIRTLGGNCRAFLSDQYKRVDNVDVAAMIAQALSEFPEVTFKNLQITDRKLYMHAVSPKLKGEVKVGDEVQGGIVISNSEIGAGAISVRPFIYRLVCLNGMVAADRAGEGYSRRHIGRRQEIETGAVRLSDEALRADAKALTLAVRDTVSQALNSATFDTVLGRMQGAALSRPIEGDPASAVERLGKSFVFSEEERAGLLANLWADNDRSQWGMLNAVTALANDNAVPFDRAVELEQIGGQILDLNPREWELVAVAA